MCDKQMIYVQINYVVCYGAHFFKSRFGHFFILRVGHFGSSPGVLFPRVMK
jgi:hypothetical protein